MEELTQATNALDIAAIMYNTMIAIAVVLVPNAHSFTRSVISISAQCFQW